MKTYNKHVFICTNNRENGKQSCGAGDASKLQKYAKDQAEKLRLKELGIRVSLSGCLGNCKSGPVLVIYPEGTWYSYRDESDIDNILSILGK